MADQGIKELVELATMGGAASAPAPVVPIGPEVWAEPPAGRDPWGSEWALRAVVDFIASKIATLPWHAYRTDPASGDRVRVHDGDLAALVRAPSCVPSQTRADLVRDLVVDGLLRDRFLALVVADRSGAFRLRRVDPSCFDIEFNALREPARVRVLGADGRTTAYDLPDPRVVLSVGYLSASGVSSVADSLAPALEEARELARYRREVARNSGRVPAWVSRPAGVPWASDEVRDGFVQGMRAYRRGGGAEGGWPLLEDGMELHEMSAFKPVDMADLDARREIAAQICAAYHVSPENVGFRTSTKSGMQAFKEQLWNVELRPYIVRFEQALNLVLPDAVGCPGEYVAANMDAVLRGTTSEQYQALSTATGRPFMSTDEARRILDMPVLGEGYDRPITPLNVTDGGQPSPQDGGRTQNAQSGTEPGGREV